ncbi:MAG: hypothetical protein JO114_19350 [Planctomycetaceae bacterium]|nr:hypothetical protein [Planctomycetaceae bacterium]
MPCSREKRAWRALALQALDSLEDMGDEEEQRETFAYLARAVNEDRLSDRLRFGS